MDYVIGGISVAALIFGIVEAAKELGVTGNGSRVLALVVGAFFVGLAQAVTQGLIPADVLPYVELFVVAVAGALAAMGYYDFAKKLVTKLRILPTDDEG